MPQKRRSSLLLVCALAIGVVGLFQGFHVAQVPASAGDVLLVGDSAVTGEEAAPQGGILSRWPATASFVVYAICFFVAKKEPASMAEDVPPFEKRKDIAGVFFMSIFLSFVSGIVNAMAIIAMGGTVAHHTGNASHVGRLLGVDAARFGALMVAYLVGASVAGYCKSNGEALYKRQFSPGMLAAAIAVAAGGVIFNASENALVALSLLSFSQGIQNAICRRCGSLPVCTTHMTGYLTDAGMGLGGWVKSGGRDPVPTRTKFFLLSIISFVLGGTAAKMLLDSAGILSAFVPAVGMGVVAFGMLPLPKPVKE